MSWSLVRCAASNAVTNGTGLVKPQVGPPEVIGGNLRPRSRDNAPGTHVGGHRATGLNARKVPELLCAVADEPSRGSPADADAGLGCAESGRNWHTLTMGSPADRSEKETIPARVKGAR